MKFIKILCVVLGLLLVLPWFNNGSIDMAKIIPFSTRYEHSVVYNFGGLVLMILTIAVIVTLLNKNKRGGKQ